MLIFGLAPSFAFVCDSSLPIAWEHVGPGGYDDGEGGIASSGAAQAATHVSGTEWLLATANGGIWHTDDITAASEPKWTPVLDNQPVTCSSISAMSTVVGGTVMAGCGAATSSEMGHTWDVANSGDWGGVMISHDSGKSWKMTAFPANTYVSSLVVVDASTLIVGVRSSLYDQTTGGGVYRSTDGGATWAQVLDKPVFDLRYRAPHLLAAVPWVDGESSAYLSSDGGSTFAPWSTGLSWGGRTPYYPNFALGQGVVFLGSLTVDPKNLSNTSSGLFVRALSELTPPSRLAPHAGWQPVANAPRLDEDGMPKDRMALLVNPTDDEMLFVAGNAGALAWRVAWKSGEWTESFGKDTSDRSTPHGDCRNYYWEPTTNALVLLNDGGAHMRSAPTKPGGKWTSLSGDTGAMEFISAAYEPKTNSWVGGAQDNCVQFAYNATATTRAIGFIEGDGTVVAVDATVSPPRFYGATQFLGNLEDDDAPGRLKRRRRTRRNRKLSVEDKDDDGENNEEEHDGGDDDDKDDEDDDDDDDDDHVGFGYGTFDPATGKLSLVGVPVLDWFDIDQLPFFDHPFALNTARTGGDDGLPVLIWARAGRGKPAGFFTVASELHEKTPPVLEQPTDGDVYRFVAGGAVDGKLDATVLVAMNDTHLLHRCAATGGKLLSFPLPVPFAKPIEFAFSSPNTYVLGPVSHDRTVSMAVAHSDAMTVAVSGWTSIADNSGVEGVWLTTDGGKTFADITGDLANATGVCANRAKCGKWRPSALLVIKVPGDTLVLVGTVSGVYASSQKSAGAWKRLGGCADLPLVLVGGLSYEATSDTVVAATMGRGVFKMAKATQLIRAALAAPA